MVNVGPVELRRQMSNLQIGFSRASKTGLRGFLGRFCNCVRIRIRWHKDAYQFTRITVVPIVVGMGIFAFFMNRWKLRSLIELSVPPRGMVLREVHPSAKDYAYLEGKNGREQELRIEKSVTEDSRPEWICSHCEQSNPASFYVCWKCDHRQPGRAKH
jgi:hypothetical protein